MIDVDFVDHDDDPQGNLQRDLQPGGRGSDQPVFTQVKYYGLLINLTLMIKNLIRIITNIIIHINMIITRNFYENFTGLSGDTLDKVANEGFRSMTAVGTMTTMMMTTIMTIMMMMKTMMMML